MEEIQRNVASGNAWRDTTHEAICDIFSSENEQHIYKRIQRLISGNAHFRKMMATLGFFRRTFQGNYHSSKPLPEDLALEIVSWLPAEDVLKCLIVCKGWMAVTLTPRFLDLHQMRAPPLILLQNYDGTKDMKLYSLDLAHEEPCIRRFGTNKLLDCESILAGTCDGLLLLIYRDLNRFRLSICNPLTGRVVMGLTVEASSFCGFWFHPFKKEYVFLTASCHRRGYCYKIFDLRGESTVLGWYEAIPSHEVPINVGCLLYYLLMFRVPYGNCIMIFNIETEKIDFKRHPHSGHCYRGKHMGLSGDDNGDMRLLEMEGSLAFAHVCSNTNSLYLWILVDHATWHWIEKYNINLNWHGRTLRPLHCKVFPLSVQKGEMLMLYHPDRLIAFNLKTRRVRKIDLNTITLKSCTSVISTTYRSSLVGLYRLAHT